MASCVIRRTWFTRPAPGVLPKIKVPNLVGQVEAAGLQMLNPWNVVGIRSTNAGGTAGNIVAQVPAATTVVRPGSAVSYTVSTG